MSTLGAYHNKCGGIISTVGMFSTLGDIMSTLGVYHDKCGGNHEYSGGVQYTGGYHEYTRDVQYTGGYHEYTEGYQDACGGLSLVHQGVFSTPEGCHEYTRGYHEYTGGFWYK